MSALDFVKFNQVCPNCGTDYCTPHHNLGIEYSEEHECEVSIDTWKCYECGARWQAIMDATPRCDVCGIQMEEAGADWCGNCGNCTDHCELWHSCEEWATEQLELMQGGD